MTPRPNESGVALVLCLLFMLALSIVAASLTVLAQTETSASVNYRLMSQARYGAESGVHKAINYLLNSYPQPGSAGDPLSNYNTSVSPVTYNGQPVVLSALDGVASNYPLASTQTAFNAAGRGSMVAGNTTVNYAASATLVSMQQFSAYGSAAVTVVQTWRVTADGSISGGKTALVEVAALLEQQSVPAHTYAAFATNAGCGALSFSGGVITDSYDSTNIVHSGGAVVTDAFGGNVGTNGNLTESGGSVINGSLSTPRTGSGNCKSGAVDALTQNGGATVTGGVVQLPQAVQYPTPAAPTPTPPTTNASISAITTCAQAGFAAANCSGPGGNLTLTTGGTTLTAGNLSLSGGSHVHLTAGTYDLNSISLSGGSSLVIDSGPVIINIAGQNKNNPIDFSGGTTSNPSLDPSKFQLLYGGAGNINLSGGTTSAAMVYGPNAAISLSGGTDFYGSILAGTFTDSGGARIHYDRHLASDFFTTGSNMMTTFTWKKY